MTNLKIAGLLVILTVFVSCKKSGPDFALLQTEKEFDFGTITLKDTVKHNFKIKNISDLPLKISEIGTSCGCTGAIVSDSIIEKNEFAEIEVQFIPKKEQTGKITNSIVIEANTNPPFTTLYLNGVVSDNDTE
ncbi:MAG: DUF1573 domain-containing protein [Flavobacterium sp.]|nr:MAG: DUF1573 domain-containing protein [Flavobacterium sp.]